MLKTKTIKETKKSKVLVAVQCDVCKKEYSADNYVEEQEFHYIRRTGGYGSVFGDEETIECDICQHCLKAMIKDFYRVVE